MGLKHLKRIDEILKGAGVPMLKHEIRNDYQNRHKYELNNNILLESLEHLIGEKKVILLKTEGMGDRYRIRS